MNTPRVRAWLLVAALYGAVLSTLGIAPDLSRTLTDRGLLDAVFGLAVLVVVVVLVAAGAGRRAGWVGLALTLGTVSVAALLVVRAAIPAAERTHLVEYAVLAVAVLAALEAGEGRRDASWRHLAGAAVITTMLGVIDEGVQAVIPNRVMDPVDMLFNAFAAVGAMAVVGLLRALPRRRSGST